MTMLRRRSAFRKLFVAAPLFAAMLMAACDRTPAPPPAQVSEEPAPAPRTPIAHIPAASAKTVGIELAKAAPAGIRETLTLYGVIRPNAEHVREVIARFPGTVKSVSKVLGDAVKQGETLATVESNESLQTYALTAPISGIVTAREADPGEQAGSDVLFSIADASSVWVELSLFPADAARVRSGQAVSIESVGGDLQGNGKIGLVGVFGSGANQALTARVVLPNPERRWTPGLFVNGAVELSKTQVPVAIAAAALQTLDGLAVVFVPVEGGFAARAVKTGKSDQAFVEVLDGLAAGDEYVAVNSFVVKAELGKSALDEDEASDGDAPAGSAAKPDADDDTPATAASLAKPESQSKPDGDDDGPGIAKDKKKKGPTR